MKYHTTITNILHSLLLLVAVVAIVLAIVPFVRVVDFGHVISGRLAERFFAEGDHTLSIGSIDAALFSHIRLQDVELRDESGETLASARDITIAVPAYRLLIGALVPRAISIAIDGLDADIDERLLTFASRFSPQGTQTSSPVREIGIAVQDATMRYHSEHIEASIDDVRGRVVLRDGQIGSSSFDAGRVSVALSDGMHASAARLTLESGLTDTGLYGARIGLAQSQAHAADMSLETPQATVFLLAEDFSGLLELSGTAVVDMMSPVAHMRAGAQELLVGSKNLHARTAFLNGDLTTANLTMDLLDMRFDEWHATLPSIVLDAAHEHSLWSLAGESDATLTVARDGLVAASMEHPVIEAQVMPNLETVRIGSSRITAEDLGSLLMMAGLRFDQVGRVSVTEGHLLGIRNSLTGVLNMETSFSLEAQTTLLFADRFRTRVVGDMELGSDLSLTNARLELEGTEASDLPGSLEGSFTYRDRTLTLDVFHSLGLQAFIEHETDTLQTRTSWRFDQFTPYPFRHVIAAISARTAELFAPESTIEGNLNVQGKADLSGARGTAELGIANLAVEDQRFNLAATLSGRLDERAWLIDLATVTTEGFRVSYTGSIDRIALIPEGTIDIREVQSGQEILAAAFEREATRSYRYRITSTRTPESRLDGIISWNDRQVLTTDANLSIPGMTYPVSVLFAIPEGIIALESDNLSARLDFLSEPGHVTFRLGMDDLLLPPAIAGAARGQGFLSGNIEADLSLADGLFLVQADSLSMAGLSWGDLEPWELDLSFDADPTQLRIDNIRYRDAFGSLAGSLSITNGSLLRLAEGKLDGFAIRLLLEGTDDSFVAVSFFPDDGKASIARGSAHVSGLDLGRFLGTTAKRVFSFDLVGETDLHHLAFADAVASLDLGDGNSLSGAFHIDEQGFHIEDARLESGIFGIHLDSGSALFDGTTRFKGSLTMDSPTFWRDGSSVFSYQASTTLPSGNSFFEWLRHIGTMDGLPSLLVTHDVGMLYGQIPWKGGSHEIRYQDRLLSVTPLEDGTLGGSYDFNSGALDVVAGEGFIIPARVKGTLTGSRISLDVRDIRFDMRHLNAVFLEPIITFESGIVQGDMLVEGPLGDPDYYGTLRGDTVEMSTFWTVGELFSIKNPVVTVTENLATIGATHVTSTHTSGRSTAAMVRLEASVERWNFPHYRIDILGIEDPISFWLPLYFSDINVEAMVSGTFSIDGTPEEETLYGDVTVSDGMINFGVPAPPAWVTEKFRTSIDMTLRTGRNVSFVYPNEESPILRATLADDQAVGLQVIAPSMATVLNGELALRSGEIYYIQKNFYVTEGAVKFPSIGGSLATDTLPTLSLRARLREFDPEGNRIDIYLVLQDAPFDDLNPRFESIPLRSTNEILELLGQSIVSPGTVGDGGLQSVVSVASAATDVFSRLGLLQGTTISLGFSNIIRDSLGLDVFTIRSNLLQNLLFDALPGIVADTSVSPLARYLDNTTMYIGNYILDEFYLQGMLHLRQDSLRGGTSFLANDLRIDTELSVEWTNPLATFSFFTRPEELSVFDLFDTMGFSVTKRFEF
jgi:hypothetical protein